MLLYGASTLGPASGPLLLELMWVHFCPLLLKALLTMLARPERHVSREGETLSPDHCGPPMMLLENSSPAPVPHNPQNWQGASFLGHSGRLVAVTQKVFGPFLHADAASNPHLLLCL